MTFKAWRLAFGVIGYHARANQAPGGNVVFPLIIKDLNGLDSVVSPVARCVAIPNLEHTDGEASPREFKWWCEPLLIYHGGIASVNG